MPYWDVNLGVDKYNFELTLYGIGCERSNMNQCYVCDNCDRTNSCDDNPSEVPQTSEIQQMAALYEEAPIERSLPKGITLAEITRLQTLPPVIVKEQTFPIICTIYDMPIHKQLTEDETKQNEVERSIVIIDYVQKELANTKYRLKPYTPLQSQQKPLRSSHN